MGTESNYKRTLAGSVGAGVGAIFSASGRTYYIIEHKTTTAYHNAGDSDKIIVDQIELGRDSSCQIRFDEACETVSRKHAAIVREGEGWKIIPLSQTNATYVNSVPVQGEKMLNSGDEIRLSSHGPVMGFIIPQGASSLVKSIGMTERMNLFRKQALAPYRKGLWTLGILLLLAIIGFVGYGVWSGQTISEQGKTIVAQGDKIDEQGDLLVKQEKDLKAQRKEYDALKDDFDKSNEKIAEQQEYVAGLERQMAINDSIRKAAEEALAVASAEEKAALEAQIEAAKKESEKARRNAGSAIQQLNEYKKSAQAQMEAIQQKEVEIKQAAAEAAAEVAANVEETVEKAAEVAEDVLFANVEDCNSAVYYVKIDNISVYKGKDLYAQFDVSDLCGGTGFMLEDGRFVTARRVIKPWLYEHWYGNIEEIIGYDSRKKAWTYADLITAEDFGFKVVGNFTAYSPAQTSFKFNSDEMTTSKTEWIYYTVNIKSKIHSKIEKIRYMSPEASAYDWATIGKREQLNVVEGLKYSDVASLNPESGENVVILGYPHKDGFSNSLSVQPVLKRNTINSPDLNNVNVIELATKRFYKGADGAPVLQNIDGVWTVIGILGHTDLESDRDFVAPIANVKK